MATSEYSIKELEGKSFPSPEIAQCPYALYSELRKHAPVYRLPSGEYVVTRHIDVARLARQPEVLSSHHSVSDDGWMRAGTLADLSVPGRAWAIGTSDPPEHSLKRKLAFEMFKPGRLQERETLIRELSNELLDDFADRGSCEFVAAFASLLPAKVILILFGLPLDHLSRALSWGRYEGFGSRFAPRDSQISARAGILDLGAFLREEILKRVDSPGDDGLSVFVHSHLRARGELMLPDLIADATNLFIGGIITTTHLISSMMMLMLQYPDQQEKARAGGPALKRAVEETLRIESPVQALPRLAVQDLEVGGTPIPAGSIVFLVWGSANRDERTFGDPERFNIERENVKDHMAFGNGIHFCLGAPLARMEAVIAFEQIFDRLDAIRFPPGEVRLRNQNAALFRGPDKLFIEFDPRSM